AFTPCWQGYALPHPAINAPDDLNNDDADAEGDQYLIFMGSVIEALDQPPLHDEPHCHGDYRRPDQADYEGTCGGEYGEARVSADNKQGAVGKVDDSQRTINDGETCRNECQQHTQSQAVKNLRHEKAHARPPSFAFVMQIWMQPIPAPETMLVSGARTSSGGRAHLATCVVHRRQGLQTVGNGNHVNQIILVLDFRGLLAANDGEVGDPVVVFRTEVDFAAHAVRTLVINAVLEGLYHGGRVEGAGPFAGIRPQQHGHVSVMFRVTRNGVVFFLIGFDEITADFVLHAFSPPEHHGAKHTLHNLRTHLFKHVSRQVGHAHLHLLEYTEFIGLLGRVHGVSAIVVVDEDVCTAVCDVQHPGAEVCRAERVDLGVVDRGPALLLRKLLQLGRK